MRKLITTLLGLLLVGSCFSQTEKLFLFEKSKKDKVQIGMSVAEIKAIFSNPKAIESGFPSSTTSIIKELPEQRGQMNYTTWFYFYPAISLIYEEPASGSYLINNKSIVKSTYDSYVNADSVYTLNGEIIAEAAAESYKTLKDKRLKKELKTSMQSTPNKVSDRYFIPVHCIIFEKGTQSVADSKMYFILK
jgi:hypothetical protein